MKPPLKVAQSGANPMSNDLVSNGTRPRAVTFAKPLGNQATVVSALGPDAPNCKCVRARRQAAPLVSAARALSIIAGAVMALLVLASSRAQQLLASGRVTGATATGSVAAAVPTGGFTFASGATDIAALLRHGPVMLGGLPSAGQGPSPWLLAIKLTDDGKGIVANDPLTGDQVALAYEPATKTVGGVAAVIDPASGKPVPLGNGAPTLTGQKIKVPDGVWSELKAFKPASYFAVSI